MRNPHFFKKCCHFRWLCFDLYRKYHNFERNEICATVFLKWTDFRLMKVFTAWLWNTNWSFFRNQRLSKNATIDSVFQASSEPNNDKPSQPYFELYKTDFDTFNALHTYLCLWGGSEGDTSVMLGMIHNILQFTHFFRSRHNFKNWRLHELQNCRFEGSDDITLPNFIESKIINWRDS